MEKHDSKGNEYRNIPASAAGKALREVARRWKLAERYNNDPKFHAMVETIVAHCYALDFESQDVLDAMTVASIRMEDHKRIERVKYVCGCEAAGDNIAATCPIHGYPIDEPVLEDAPQRQWGYYGEGSWEE